MPTDAQVREAVLTLLARRAPNATVCPSEVARTLAKNWRGAMPSVHDAIDAMVAQGMVELSWKGNAMARRDGPYRIARIERDVTSLTAAPGDDSGQNNI